MRTTVVAIVVATILLPADRVDARRILGFRPPNPVWDAQAAVYYHQAERLAIQNHLLRIQSYFEGRRLNREYRASERGQPASMEQLVRFARNDAPRRLRADELNPETGEITWPIVLRGEIYRDDREQLDEYFGTKARHPAGLDAENYQRAVDLTGDLLDKLRGHIRQMFSGDYLLARNFLKSLALEARYGKDAPSE